MIEKVEGTTSYEYKQPIKGNSPSKITMRMGAANPSKKPEGVILDLSVNSEKANTVKQESQGQFSIWKSIQSLFSAIKAWLIDFWESDSEAEKKEALLQEEPEQEGIVTDISNEDLELYTLLAEMSVGHIQLDDLDSAQVSRLLEIGMDLDAAEDGTFDYTKLLEDWSAKLGILDMDADSQANTEKQPEVPSDELGQGRAENAPLIQAAVQAGSLTRLEELITQNGTKKLAHNSDLLTYYDKKGQLVHLDDTQKHRVLYGDRNILKL